MAFVAVAAVVVVVALKGDSGEKSDAAAQADRPQALITTGETWSKTTSRFTTTSTTVPSSPSSTVTSGFHRVTGPNGISAEVPSNWLVKAGTQATNIQVDNPESPGSLIRLGGSPSGPLPLLDSVASNETQNGGISQGYQRLRLERVSGNSNTVVWEFLYTKDGEQRHAFGRYWRTGGIDYIVYGSANTASWPTMKTVLDIVVRTTTM
ncbi:hypothetical protein [Umezawaea sp. NPDC059074]|uniref:hypothetical protein n=1 Tax=Umezawaea sp. NPDC059074 TaxID=3346716 RepID=UPI0036CBB2EA